MKSYPLTQTMLGMFLEWDRDHESTQYTLATVHVFPKAIDLDLLVRAIEETLNAHDVFKMRFVKEDEEVRWTIDDGMDLKVERRSMSDAEADKLQKFFSRGFDAFNGPLVRIQLIETPTTYRMLCEMFHLIMDGSSYRVLLDEIVDRYSGKPVAESAPNFTAYVEAEQRSFDSPEYAEAREAAIARFVGRSMSVPEDDSEIPAYTSRDYHFLESVMSRAGVDAYCKTNGLSPNLFFMGVFARTLALFTNEKDAVFTTVNHGRGRDGAMHKVLGCCVKNIPVLGELKPDTPVDDYLRSFKLHKAGVYPFTHFCRELNFGAGWCIIYQEGTVDFQLTLDGIRSEGFTPMSAGAGELPGLQIYGGEKEFRFELTCAFGKYSRAFLARFLERFQIIAANILASDPGASLKNVSLLTADEQAEVVNLSYGGDMEYDRTKTFVDLFREQLAARPEAIAVVDCETSLTYRELDERSDRLASVLMTKGVVPGDFVAIKLPRRVSFVVAMIAIQKCGAGYVPLDPEYPQDRLDYMISDSQSKLVVDEEELKCEVEVEERKKKDLDVHNCSLLTAHCSLTRPEGPAYMIYTSGSTGRPKGVVLSQRAVMNLIQWYARDCGVGPGKRNVHLASFSFDASVPDLFTPLAFGGELHILSEEMRKDLSSVGDYCVAHQITGATMSTKMGLALVNSYPELPLDFMLLGGEKMTAFAKTPVRMINGYGPTEFAVCSSFHEVDQSRSYDIPIGRAVPNTYSFVVDKLGQLVPRGMTGEIALAGVQLSDGYWHQPEKTSKAFVALPSATAHCSLLTAHFDRMYRTGDLGRYNADGELDFLGRLDFQVKLRGFRIEIGEIEHVASTFPGVGGVIALVKTIAGTEHLVLYYDEVGDSSLQLQLVSPTDLKNYLASKLTPYMVPDYFVAMEKLPQTPGGKIDRNALPLPKTDDEPIVAAEGETESKLLECVRSVLKREDFGVTHDFNHLGLTSLGAMELVVKIKKNLGVKVTMRQLAEHPSVRQLAEITGEAVDCQRGQEAAAPVGKSPLTGEAASSPLYHAAMSENQRGIYVDWLRNPGTTQYNIPGVVRFPNLDPQSLAKAVEKVIAAHLAFRVHFANYDSDVMQELSDPQFANCGPVEVVELDHEPDTDFFSSQVKPFAPTASSLSRIKIYHHSSPSPSSFTSYLFLDIHHTIFDGVSMGVFLNELMRVLDGGEPQGEECSLMQAAEEERKYLTSVQCEEDEKWFERYLDGMESTRLEENHLPGFVSGAICGRVSRSVPSASIVSFCKDHGVSPSDYLLTAFTELLKRIGRSEDVLINFVSAGRTDPSLSNTIGMFVKTLPIRGVKEAKTFTEAVSKLHLDVLDILDRSRVSFARLSERLGVRPDILFVYEGGIFELPHGASLIEVPSDTPKAPLSLVVNPSKDDFKLIFEYDRTLYSSADIERLASMLVVLAGEATSSSLLKDIPLVSAEESERILSLSYGGDLDYDSSKTFLTLFHANVITRSFATAVVDSERSLTYGELDERSNVLAQLLSSRGVVAGDFVAVKLPRTVDFIVAVLAIEKLGAAYIPVDPEYPQDRIDYIVSDSGSKLVVDEEELKCEVEVEERNKKGLDVHNCSLLTVNCSLTRPEGPAYMIYTSGSTGRPKGVVMPHLALRNMIEWVTKCYGIHPGTKIATHPSFSFDASVIDIFPTLAAGGELHILSDAIRKDIPSIRDYIVEHDIEGMTMSTQIGMALLDSYPDLPLKYLQCGGEKMMPVAKTKVRIINGYGPTEFCVCSSYEVVDQDKEGDIPIGRAVPNTYSLIVDRYGHLLPQGAAGELTLAGPQIADGYWHQPEKTSKAFVAQPSTIPNSSFLLPNSALMYRTGDLARYNAEGKLEYLGRLDFQVKLRGFRIEIGEIESVAKQFPGIGAVAAEVREVGGAKHLVLYYDKVGDSSLQLQLVSPTDLKLHLEQRLTDYMVPDYFVEVEKMPMTPNGKIDRRKLKSPSVADTHREYVEPANDTERKIAKCYGEILKIERYGATDDFFELGGTSIVAIKAVVSLQKAGLDVQYGDVFKYKTPRSLANLLGGQRGQEAAAPVGESPLTGEAASSPLWKASTLTGEAASSPLSVYADFDYTAVDKLLENTRNELYGSFRRHALGDVLLTGATGYLGMHILRYLLERTDSTVYALVRSKKGVKPARRIDSQYVYYFGERIPKPFLDRLEFLEGDITDDELELRVGVGERNVSTVINCAALVKHYVADDLMDRINVGGVEKLIAFCEKSGARLIHTSTYSVGGTIRADSFTGLDERHLYIGQDSDNDYVRTKFLAERAVLAAIAAGRIRGKIMRLGNLMGRESDGEFQMNTGANAFVNSLKTYHALGAYPLEELAKPLEMSPIDRVAEAICLLSTTPDDMCVFHPYNRYALDMGAVIAALNARGLNVDVVSREEFAAHVDALKNDPKRAAELQGILHYAGHLLENRKMTPVDNTWTTTVLYRLGFRWRPADDRYLASFFDMLDGLAVFG